MLHYPPPPAITLVRFQSHCDISLFLSQMTRVTSCPPFMPILRNYALQEFQSEEVVIYGLTRGDLTDLTASRALHVVIKDPSMPACSLISCSCLTGSDRMTCAVRVYV